MSLGLPRARKVLVVAPHPDDEAIGAYALMAALRRRGARVWVMVVSDGAASHPGSLRWPAQRLSRARRRETRLAMATLGITPDRIRFLALPDGALGHDPDALRARMARELCRMPRPALIVGPVADDAHADHRAVASALTWFRVPQRLGYQVWPLSARPQGLRVTLDPRLHFVKRRIVRSYRTQAGVIGDSATGMTITRRHLARFAAPAEHFRVIA